MPIEQICTQMLLRWATSTPNIQDIEYAHESPIVQLLKNKLSIYKVPITVSEEALLLIDVCSRGHAGCAQLMLKQLIGDYCPEGISITVSDFYEAFPLLPLNLSIYLDAWDLEKDRCDSCSWWMECFK